MLWYLILELLVAVLHEITCVKLVMVPAAVWLLSAAVEKVASAPSDTGNTNLWIVVGVVIPLLVVIIIISILYWKLCRTDKLEFQPDAMTSIQQRQKVEPLQSVLFHLFIYYWIDRRWLLSFWEHLTHFLGDGWYSRTISHLWKWRILN